MEKIYCHSELFTVSVKIKNCYRGTPIQTLSKTISSRDSLRSRRLELVGTRKNGRARRRHARGEGVSLARARSLFRPLLPTSLTLCVSPSRAPVLFFAHYFQAPATQAILAMDNSTYCLKDSTSGSQRKSGEPVEASCLNRKGQGLPKHLFLNDSS